MIKKLSVGIILFCLVGCATTPVVHAVNIPIPVITKATNVPPKPYLPIYSLNEKSSPDMVLKAYLASLVLMDQYSNALLTIIKN